MATGPLLVLLVFSAALVAAVPLKKEVLNLPPLIHFSDIFNTQPERVDKTFTDHSSKYGTKNAVPPHTVYPYPYPPSTGYPVYPQPTYPQPTYPQPTYPQTSYPPATYPQTEYPQIGYPQISYIPIGYPPQQTTTNYPQYPQYPPLPSYPQYPPYPPNYPVYPRRHHDVEIVERYWKFNDDGSKEYKLVMSNGLNVYQKVLTKPGDKENIQLIEGYYSDRRDDNTFLNTYFSASDSGYSASSEISNSPPPYPDTNEMLSYPLTHRKTRN